MLFFDVNFLFLFLVPVVVISYSLVAAGFRSFAPWVAIGASLVFLGVFSWVSVAVAVLSLSINYAAGKYLLAHRRKKVLAGMIAANLAMLSYFKYSILINGTFFHDELPLIWRLALPLGISFYTFQQIAFLSDIYRGKTTSFSLRTYLLFKLFFPQLIAGPIVHFERVRASYERWPTFNPRSVRFGLLMISLGFLKKLAGDYFGTIADISFDHQAGLSMYGAWVGALAFSFQIYFDFSGYSDMAVGLARLFGVSLPFNFNSPYKAKSIPDFWRRWHITLSTWLRDYLYIPLGGSRKGRLRTFVALFMTMALGGLWHGASWTFLAWGAAHGISQIVIRLVRVKLPAFFGRSLLLLFIMLTWILFRSETFAGALDHYSTLFAINRVGVGVELWRVVNLLVPVLPVPLTVINRPEQVLQLVSMIGAAAVCIGSPNSQQISLWLAARRVAVLRFVDAPVLATAIVIISLAFISPDTSNAFIYFEF